MCVRVFVRLCNKKLCTHRLFAARYDNNNFVRTYVCVIANTGFSLTHSVIWLAHF